MLLINTIAKFLAKWPLFVWNLRYFRRQKHFLHPKNPKNMSDLIVFMALYRENPLWPDLADKYKVRDYVTKTIGVQYLNELYGCWNQSADINFDSLPNSFVLKTNNSCATNIFVRDKRNIVVADICRQLDNWLKFPYGELTGQVHYTKIKPLIIAEKFMLPTDGSSSLVDFKFYCMHDTILGILVCANRRERSHLFDAMVFDADWKEHPEYVSSKYPLLKYFHRPVSFTDMLQAVKKLADPFEFVRVDFYEVDGYPIFGEMTFTPDMSGALSTLYKNLLFNKIFPTLKSIK